MNDNFKKFSSEFVLEEFQKEIASDFQVYQKYIDSLVNEAKKNQITYKHWIQIGSTEKIIDKLNYKSASDKKLFGLAINVKDIIATEEFPTGMGVHSAWSGTTGSFDARCVSDLRKLGCAVIGKTVSSEFAVHKPTYVVNPRNLAASAGTSSSGSAVSVALGEVPISLATQTAGSIARPASYCGVIGFKPSFGDIPRTGILKTTELFDSVGFFASNLSTLKTVYLQLRVQGNDYPIHTLRRKNQKKISKFSILIGNKFDEIDYENIENYSNQIKKLFPHLDYEELNFDEIIDISLVRKSHETIYKKEVSIYLHNEISHPEISKQLKIFAEEGTEISMSDYHDAKNTILEWKKIVNLITPGCILLSPATCDTFIFNEEEKYDSNLLYTAAGIPQLIIPKLEDLDGNLTGLSISSEVGSDEQLIGLISSLRR